LSLSSYLLLVVSGLVLIWSRVDDADMFMGVAALIGVVAGVIRYSSDMK
jgi:hypothetical protein